MLFVQSPLLFSLLGVISVTLIDGDPTEGRFPENFLFGVGSSAYQTEGSGNEDGRGENIWDHFRDVTDDSNESYEKFKDDVALVAEMNLRFYKFSLSWSRILPSGFNDSVNQKGVEYYKSLIGELEKRNITPMVTIYHWDLPQVLQDRNGWTNESNIQFFVDYARVVFQNFPTVKYWLTMHEPKQICRGGYGTGSLAPFVNDSGVSDYKCARVVLKAHAAVYRMYHDEFPDLKGRISIALDGSWSIPIIENNNNRKAAERRNQFEFGLYAEPIFKTGNWPQTVKSIVDQDGKGRLPGFTPEESSQIKGTADFMALNYYEARVVQYVKPDKNNDITSYEHDLRMNISKDPSWAEGANGFAIVPWSLRNFLNYIATEYNNPEIIITGNGVADDGSLEDSLRINYMADHLSSVLDAIHIDKLNVTGYIFWSLLDGFEWTDGYNLHFGLHSVDRSSTNKSRIAKESSRFYQKIATDFRIPTPSSESTTSCTTNESSFTASSTTENSSTGSSTTENISTTSSTTENPSTESSTTENISTASSTTENSSTESSTTENISTASSTTENSSTESSTTTTKDFSLSTDSSTEIILKTTSNSFSSSTVKICSYVLLVVSIICFLIFFNGMFLVTSLPKSSLKIV